MSISATIKDGEKRVVISKYEPGFLVENQVSKPYSKTEINFQIVDDDVRILKGKLPEALDDYFNSWSFRTDKKLIPDELTRCGRANEHRSLFLTAVRLLEKSIKTDGYKVEIDFL